MMRQVYQRKDQFDSVPTRDAPAQDAPWAARARWAVTTTLYELPDGSLWTMVVVTRSAPDGESGTPWVERPAGFVFQSLSLSPGSVAPVVKA